MSWHQLSSVDANDREVCIGVIADESCFAPPTVVKCDFDFRCIVDDVTVRENEAVGSEDETRTAPVLLSSLATRAGRRASRLLPHVYIDDRGTDALRRACE
jgi:hypothetical protein